MIKLYLLSTLELNENKTFEAACGKLDAGRLEKVRQAKRREDKILRAGAGLLLQYAVKKGPVFEYGGNGDVQEVSLGEILETVTEPLALDFCYGPHGKPYFADALKEVTAPFFSLSHSGDYVLCVLSDREVGADIQVIPKDTEKQREREARIAEKFFSESERRYLTADGEEQTRQRFYRIWAAKEAYTKYTGQGLSQGIDSFTVDLEQGKIGERALADIYTVDAPPEYAAVVVCGSEQQERNGE